MKIQKKFIQNGKIKFEGIYIGDDKWEGKKYDKNGENEKKEDIIDFIIEFIQDFVKEVTDMKMTVNSQSRYATTYLMEHVKV